MSAQLLLMKQKALQNRSLPSTLVSCPCSGFPGTFPDITAVQTVAGWVVSLLERKVSMLAALSISCLRSQHLNQCLERALKLVGTARRLFLYPNTILCFKTCWCHFLSLIYYFWHVYMSCDF